MSKQNELAQLADAVTVDGDTIYVDSNGQDAGYTPLQIGNTSNSNTIVQILSANNGVGTVHFGDATSGSGRYIGFMNYDHTIDQFQIGTNDSSRFKIDSSGAVTKPNQPAFHVTKGTNQSPIGSTINVEYTVVWASEKYDIGGNFSGSQFTAPVAGKYVFQAQTMLTGTETQGNYYWMRINTSNGNIGEIQSIKYASNPTYLSLGSHCIVDMDVGDTASVGVRYGSVVGSNPNIVVDDSWTWFMGYLLG